ncbi:MAG: hypothetical protein WCF84_25060 [Anaerolineae bacterium]
MRICLYGAALLALALLAACTAETATTPTPGPAAGVVLQKILNDCWGVSQIKDLDGNRADHKAAFECARPRLLELSRDYPEAAEPHRVLAWGYLYAQEDDGAAEAEYERAAAIYAKQGRAADQADILIRIGQLVIQHDQRSGCDFLRQAAQLDPQNTRITTLLQNFECIPRTVLPERPPTPGTAVPTSSPTPSAAATPAS